jgi:hypothetical protein
MEEAEAFLRREAPMGAISLTRLTMKGTRAMVRRVAKKNAERRSAIVFSARCPKPGFKQESEPVPMEGAPPRAWNRAEAEPPRNGRDPGFRRGDGRPPVRRGGNRKVILAKGLD